MKKLAALLSGFTAGDWIAAAVVVSLLLWVGWNTTGAFLGLAVTSLQPELPSNVDTESFDLIAQRSMAAAAWWMVVLSGISVVVGAASLYLIFCTLHQAQRSADFAQDAVKASCKPFKLLGRLDRPRSGLT